MSFWNEFRDALARRPAGLTQARADLSRARKQRDGARALVEHHEGLLAETRMNLRRSEQERHDVQARLAKDHDELRDKRTDLLNIRGILSPQDRSLGLPPVVPMPLGREVAPAVDWLVDEADRLREQLAQVAKITDQIESAAASDGRNRDERIEAAIAKDGVWSSQRNPDIARVSVAIDIQTSIAKRLRRALAGGEASC